MDFNRQISLGVTPTQFFLSKIILIKKLFLNIVQIRTIYGLKWLNGCLRSLEVTICGERGISTSQVHLQPTMNQTVVVKYNVNMAAHFTSSHTVQSYFHS
jgi:hypothetical protein